ncbi:MAG TPA: response regulator [Candidatus Peribacteraceae bacterium]|nr:response regulator [Candidatus Peribacteraceae bacterium]
MKPLFLIADDSESKRELLERIVLRNVDVQVLTAQTTEEAHELIVEHVEFAGAFIDYEIPSENGPAVIAHLKKHNPNCCIALVTSADCSHYREEAERAGAEAFVSTAWPLDRVETELNLLLAGWKVQMDEN